MPGLLGIAKSTGSTTTADFSAALNLLAYDEQYKYDLLFEDHALIASRVHMNKIGEKDSPHDEGGIYCWIEGEAYNSNEVAKVHCLKAGSFPELLVESYSKGILERVLADIDGYYTAVVYDQHRALVMIISDRYGLKPLYLWSEGRCFGWSSEMKAFLKFAHFTPVIRKDALACFMDLGHMMGNMTWFNKVTLMEPSTILSYSLRDAAIIRSAKYWKWSCIKPQVCSFQHATEDLGDLIESAVRRRIDDRSRFGISLSGGLDSRAILASLNDVSRVVTYTFGKPGCDDIETARLVSSRVGVKHIVREITRENWMVNRLFGIWKTDGMWNIYHMHDTAVSEAYTTSADINLSGFLGDALEGGLYLRGKAHECRIDKKLAEKYFNGYAGYSDYADDFFDIDHMDVYVFQNRSRRFTTMGLILDSKYMEHRLPFLDNRLIEFIYSLPDAYRVNSRLYNASLMRKFPEFYRDIPWQRTGYPITKRVNRHYLFLKKSFALLLRRLNLKAENRDYADYWSWFKDGNVVPFFRKLLDPRTAIYSAYTSENYVEKYLDPHVKSLRDHSEQLGLALSVEIWLQQVYNKRYMTNTRETEERIRS